MEPMQAPIRPRKKPGIRAVLMTLLVLFALLVVLNASVLQIREFNVIGNSAIPKDQVLQSAGLKDGLGFFSINRKAIEEGVNSNRYLVFKKLETEFPGTINLYVYERVPLANVIVMGVMYVLDAEGMVLERSTTVKLDNGLVTVNGILTKEVRVGKKLVGTTDAYINSYQIVLEELALQNYLGEISELNISNPDSLYLVTVDGYTVHLGDTSNMRAKIGTIRAVIKDLRSKNMKGGTIEGQAPGAALYSPPNL